MVKIWQAVVSGLSIGSIYALIAQGYYVTFITTATLNFGQGEFLMIGAMVGLTAYVTLGLPFPIALLRRIEVRYRDFELVLWPAVACSGAMAIGLLTLRAWLPYGTWPAVVSVVAQVAAGGVIFGLVLLVFFRQRLSRYVRFLRELREKKAPAAPAPATP